VDELTQVYNFRALFEIGENEFARACQQQRPLSAIFIDIDHFGEFNTRYSHTVGNQVLRAVGRRLLAITRQADLVARFGGEEFVVLLPETDAPLATTIGYRIHQEISKLQVATDHGQLGVTVSVGVAARAPEMRALQDLINRANAGEHRAKAEGRNRVVVC
jgi:diguanylate cyclase (GGDEF)-like protein